MLTQYTTTNITRPKWARPRLVLVPPCMPFDRSRYVEADGL